MPTNLDCHHSFCKLRSKPYPVCLLVGLFGLIMPVFPGLVIMWLGTLVYALIQNAADKMTGWDWFAFALITLLMIVRQHRG